MEVLDSQVIGGLIGLGLVVKGMAEWLARRNGKGTPPLTCTKCNTSPEFEAESKERWQECMLILTEIRAILRERKN